MLRLLRPRTSVPCIDDRDRPDSSPGERFTYPPEYFRPPQCVSCRREIIQPAMMAFAYPPICVWCWKRSA